MTLYPIPFLAALLFPLLAIGVPPPKPSPFDDPPPQPVNESVPPKSNNYPPGPDSLPQPGVPAGATLTFPLTDSKIFPGTTRTITVYVPAAYQGDKPACVFVFLDNIGFKATTVFDNLIAKHQMPMTIAVGISFGTAASASLAPYSPSAPSPMPASVDPRLDRCFEFDSMTDRLARCILEEILPAVGRQRTPDGKPILLSENPDDRAIAGGSSGAIAAFNVAWQRPDAFHRVFTGFGTFVGMRGGERYSTLVRKSEPKPLRVFMQDGVNDQVVGEIGDWWMSNLTMERALEFAGYDVNHVWGAGSHNPTHAIQIFPDAMRWLWRDWPAPIKAQPPVKNFFLVGLLEPGEGWQTLKDAAPDAPSLAADLNGNILWSCHGNTFSSAPDGTVKKTPLPGGVLACGPDGKIYSSQVAGLSPRYLTVRHNGDVYLTTSANELWLVRANGGKTRLDTDLKSPSGLSVSPDGLWLFVSQAGSRWALSYRVQADGSIDDKEPFYDCWVPDWADDSGAEQVAWDRNGRAFVATRSGVQVFDRNGRVRAILPVPGNAPATGLCFGGPAFDVLYVSSGGTIYRRKMHTPGLAPGSAPIELPRWQAG